MAEKQVVVNVPTKGGGHVATRRTVRVAPTPVTIVPRERQISPVQRVAGSPVTRLGTPSAFLMLAGLFLVYYALQGWDRKYGTFGGTFAGKGAVPVKAGAAPAVASVIPSQPKVQSA